VALRKLRVLDLFSGAGMFSLGLERSGGFKTIAFCEIEDYPRRVLAKHWPGVQIYNDVREINRSRLNADGIQPDVIVGGFPCQDLSFAGKGAGLGGDQSGLWREFIRLIREVRPSFVIVENVAALLRRGIGDVLGGLAEAGYDAEWDCISASFVGAPHNRDRIWIVAYPKRDEQSWPEPCFGAVGRMGRGGQYIPWDTYWKDALAEIRRMDDGNARSVDRADMIRNSLVPQIPELIGCAILESIGWTPDMMEATHV
jgi:DNA (cytosine-5)-methyltransferase 1